MDSKLRVVHVVAGLGQHAGGPSFAVTQLADALVETDHAEVVLVSPYHDRDGAIVKPASSVDLRLCSSRHWLLRHTGMLVKKEIENIAKKQPPRLIHGHGVWLPVNHWSASASLRFGIPLVVHPHGMLEPWALNYAKWKKRIAMLAFQRRDLNVAALLVATSEEEYRSLRALGFSQPIAVIPNGVLSNRIESHGNFRPCGPRVRTVLFLSRIHPKKGLLNLIDAWSRLNPANWRLRIVGPDEGGHLAVVRAAARAKGVDSVVEYMGPVYGADKTKIYSDADLFVLPTFSENFGVVVAEALAHGLPVITTKGTPWSDLTLKGCGWWIDIGVDPLVEALRDAIMLSDDERHLMGGIGREYVRRYDWGAIANETIQAYRWILNLVPRPECVRTD